MSTNYFLRSEEMQPDHTYAFCAPEVTRLLELVSAASAATRARAERPWEAGAEALRWFEHEISPLVEQISAEATPDEAEVDLGIHDGVQRFATNGLHIGMSSFGWAFSLRLYPATIDQHESSSSSWIVPNDGKLHHVRATLGKDTVDSLGDWEKLFRRFGCVDEYGVATSADEMMKLITKRARTWLRRLNVRDGYGPVPGADYDLCVGEFS